MPKNTLEVSLDNMQKLQKNLSSKLITKKSETTK